MNAPRCCAVLLFLFLGAGCNTTGPWGWKRSETPDDVMKFLNGSPPYSRPVAEARIAARSKGSNVDFTVFYVPGAAGSPPGTWGWKKATTVTDALNFLNGQGGYTQPVAAAEIAAAQSGATTEFYIFYRTTAPPAGSWGWKLSSDPDDVMRFLNGSAPYTQPVGTARVVGVGSSAAPQFYVFYRRTGTGTTVANWAWKKSVGPDGPGDVQNDLQKFVNGTAPYSQAVADFEVGATASDPATTTLYAFHNQGTRLWIRSPLEGERFVTGEKVPLRALLTSHKPMDGSQVTWTSSIGGALGSGIDVLVSSLAVGTHVITATGYGDTRAATLREFADLGAFYQAAPAQAELDRIAAAFTFTWPDGTAADQHWAAYDPPGFNQTSLLPSKLVVQARLDVLRHQAFSEPLPYGDGRGIYDHFRTYVNAVTMRLDCTGSYGGGGVVSIDRMGSVWWNLTAGPCMPPPSPPVAPYVDPLYLLIHEGRHSQPGEPGHTTCNGQSNMDAMLDGGSGHAWAALYTMWVYKYGLYDPPDVKNEAKMVATSLLQSRFCTKPTSSNPKVQAILTELLP